MPRRRRILSEILADPVYNSELVSRFINKIMVVARSASPSFTELSIYSREDRQRPARCLKRRLERFAGC